MQVTVYAEPRAVTGAQLHNKTVIVIDVLRATTCITTAIEMGAAQIIPAKDPGEAMQLFMRLGRADSVLAGERDGLKIPDFHLGNSPLEYTAKSVGGKNVILTTSNGTNAILSARNAGDIFIGCMRNRTAVVKAALATHRDILILCAGTDGFFSADDICCAGSIVDAIRRYADTDVFYDDLSQVSYLVYDQWRAGNMDLSTTHHYSRLLNLEFSECIDYCLTTDVCSHVGIYKNGVIVS